MINFWNLISKSGENSEKVTIFVYKLDLEVF